MTYEQTLSHVYLATQISPIFVMIGAVAFVVGLISLTVVFNSSTINKPAITVLVVCCASFAGAYYIVNTTGLTSAEIKSLQSAPSRIVSTKTIQLVQAPDKNQPMFYNHSKSDVSYWTASSNQTQLNTVPVNAKLKFVSLGDTKQLSNTVVIETFQYLNPKIDEILQHYDNAHDTYVFVNPSK